MNGFIPDPDWTPYVDNTNIKITELSDFYTNEDIINILGTQYPVTHVIRDGVIILNREDNQEEMKFLADEGTFRDRFFIENSRDEDKPYTPLTTKIYFYT